MGIRPKLQPIFLGTIESKHIKVLDIYIRDCSICHLQFIDVLRIA